MSKNLTQAINDMRNMREVYNGLQQTNEVFSPELQAGKSALASAITNKGVETASSDTLTTMAGKVNAIAQESYAIDGGEMYAKQLFGSLETPNYWNLYEVLMQLLSDGRLVSYGGILLAEYYRGYDNLALAGAGAGGAYVVSDKDSQGNFIMYTNDTTHVWDTAFDGKGNRWVAYCFADDYHDFQITDTNTSPRSVFIGRKVGMITSLVNGRISEIVVPDGNILKGFDTGSYTQNFGKKVILKNTVNPKTIISSTGTNIEQIYVEAESLIYDTEGNAHLPLISLTASNYSVSSIMVKVSGKIQKYGIYAPCDEIIVYANEIICDGSNHGALLGRKNVKRARVITESFAGYLIYVGNLTEYLYLGFIDNNKDKSVSFGGYGGGIAYTLSDVELMDGWCKPLNISLMKNLTKENVQAHIFDQLGVNDLSTGAVTITLATAVLNLFTQEEIDAVVARTNITIVGA